MAHASTVPSLDADIHLVLCRFGRAGLAYIETDPAEADATTVVQNLLYGRYGQPLRVVALNVDEGWSQDVSEAMARKVLEIAEREDYELTQGTLQFLEAHSPSVVSADITRGSRHGVRRPVARAWMRYSGRAKRGGRSRHGGRASALRQITFGGMSAAPPLALSDAFSLPKLRPSKRTEPREG